MMNGESGCGAYDILKMQRTILKIQEIMKADPFSAKEPRDEICAINLEHPENLVIYGLLFPQNSLGARIVDADKECLIRDLQWQKSVVAKAIEYGRDVVPVRFEALNSARFYRMARLRKRLGIRINLEQIMLPGEVFSQRGKKFRVVFGAPVSAADLRSSGKSPKELAGRLREKVYSL